MKNRIGILTAGGDCPGLNAAIRGVTRAAYEMFDAEIIGIHDGYLGLNEGDYQVMKRSDFSGILTQGGTIPAYRKQGIGLKMVQNATAILKEVGYDLSYIHYTAVGHWYARLGYQTILRWNSQGIVG